MSVELSRQVGYLKLKEVVRNEPKQLIDAICSALNRASANLKTDSFPDFVRLIPRLYFIKI